MLILLKLKFATNMPPVLTASKFFQNEKFSCGRAFALLFADFLVTLDQKFKLDFNSLIRYFVV